MPIEYLLEGVSNELFCQVLELQLEAGFDPFALPSDYDQD